MRRLLVNDQLSAMAHRTFWHDLLEWFDMEFHGGDFASLADLPEDLNADLIVRNASYFGPLKASNETPTIGILQDIFDESPGRKMQEEVIDSCWRVVFNSAFTASKYQTDKGVIISLPVDFDVFYPQNRMGCQQMLALPDRCVAWVGACEAAGNIKGWDIFLQVVRANPDISFVAVLKDAKPHYAPYNLRSYVKQTHQELAAILSACTVGLCTSRQESQHLAGIEMGAIGLPLVAPMTGIYYDRTFPGRRIQNPTPEEYGAAIRSLLEEEHDRQSIRSFWKSEFDREVIRKQWKTLIEEIECSGPS